MKCEIFYIRYLICMIWFIIMQKRFLNSVGRFLIILKYFYRNVPGLADCTDHMDYMTLKKRLLVCMSLRPTVENFIDRFIILHKKWSRYRWPKISKKILEGLAWSNLWVIINITISQITVLSNLWNSLLHCCLLFY